MLGIPLEKLELTTRANHILHRMDIHTVEEMLNITEEELINQRNAGKKTIEEIKSVISKINDGEIKLESLEICHDIQGSDQTSFTSIQLEEFAKHDIKELDLSVRAYRCLIRQDMYTLDRVVVLSEDDLLHLEGLGTKSKDEILEKKKEWLEENIFDKDTNRLKEFNEDEKEYFSRIAELIEPISKISWKKIYYQASQEGILDQIINDGLEVISSENLLSVFRISLMSSELRKFFSVITEGLAMITEEELDERLAKKELIFNENIIKDSLLDNSICVVEKGYWIEKREHLTDYVKREHSDVSNRNDYVFNMRLRGKSLQEIADICELSRERVRQITNKTVEKFPNLYEDYFQEPFKYFKFSKKEFCSVFEGLTSEAYEYMNIRYKKGKVEITRKNVDEYHGKFKEQISVFCEKEAITHDKKSVRKTEMIYRVLRANSDIAMNVDEFMEVYYDYIDCKGYPRHRLELNERTLSNYLRTALHIVFDKSNRLRYCDADVSKLWSEIDFTEYKGLIISSELIYRDYKELMDDLDIRDGYELFYLLKASPQKWDNEYEIIFRRVPMMIMGDGDEERQAIQLLKEISPVGFYEYYEMYEMRYGMRKESAASNPTVSAAMLPYYVDGTYYIDAPCFDWRDEETMKQVLAEKSIWLKNDLEKIVHQYCKFSSEDVINTAAFKRIGYTLNTGYAYSDEYKTGYNLFEEIIFSEDIVDLSTLDRRVTVLPVFGAVLERKKKTLDYIETAPKILMSIDAVERQYGINKDDIREIQEMLQPYYDIPYFNAHSIWSDIQDIPLIKKLSDNEWMCTCIMRQQEDVFSTSVSGGIILSADSKSLTISKICNWIFEREGQKSIKVLTNRFNDIFGTQLPWNKIADKLKSSGYWDKVVTDSLDDYLETLISPEEIDLDDLFEEEFF